MIISPRAIRITLLACLFGMGLSASAATADTALETPTILLRPLLSGTISLPKTLVASRILDQPPVFGPSLQQERARPMFAPQPEWPRPVHDQGNRLFFLVDALEYRPKTGAGQRNDGYRWDTEGWYGGDYNRLWFKSE